MSECVKLEDMVKDELKKKCDEAYNKGLNAAWELMKKLWRMPIKDFEDIFGPFKLLETNKIFDDITPQEALKRIEVYKKEQAEIKVGDVVIPKVGRYRQNEKGVVIGLYDKDDLLRIYVIHKDSNGNIDNTYYHKESLTKTGKHIDLQTILEQIAGD